MLFYHALVAIRIWGSAVARQFWNSILEFARYKALLWSALFNTLPRIVGFVLIGFAAFRLSPALIALLDVELETATRLAELKLLVICLAYFAVMVIGVFLISWTLVKNARDRFHEFYGRLLGSFLAACVTVGLVFWGFRAAGTFESLSGFNQLGSFSIALLALAALTGAIQLYVQRKQARTEKETAD